MSALTVKEAREVVQRLLGNRDFQLLMEGMRQQTREIEAQAVRALDAPLDERLRLHVKHAVLTEMLSNPARYLPMQGKEEMDDESGT